MGGEVERLASQTGKQGLAHLQRERADSKECRRRRLSVRSREILIPFRLWNRFSFGDNISYSVISHSARDVAQLHRNRRLVQIVRGDARLVSASHRASPDICPGRRAHADAVYTGKTGAARRSNRDHQSLLLRSGG